VQAPLLVVLGWVGLGQSADGLGWIGSHKMDPWTTLWTRLGAAADHYCARRRCVSRRVGIAFLCTITSQTVKHMLRGASRSLDSSSSLGV